MTHLLLIGCGNMGSALLARWQSLGLSISVVELQPIGAPSVPHFKTLGELPTSYQADMIVLAVKPQQMDALLPQLAARFGTKPSYLSIAAGKTLGYFAIHLKSVGIIRAMPNTPAMIGKGMTALIGNAHLSSHARNLATKLMQAVGEVVWLDDETHMDVVTAISGSGPAYFFTFMACMIEAAVKQGLSPEIAEKLVKQTAIGATALASTSHDGLCDLIKNVTSKGGTTEAALAVFNNKDALNKLVGSAVKAAMERSKELG